MPPKHPPSPEHGMPPYAGFDADVVRMSKQYGMSRTEVIAVIEQPYEWIQRLADPDNVDTVVAEVTSELARYEATYGPSEDWDITRSAMVAPFIAVGRLQEAAVLTVDARDITKTIEGAIQIIRHHHRTGEIGEETIDRFYDALMGEFESRGRGKELLEVLTHIHNQHSHRRAEMISTVIEMFAMPRFTPPKTESEPEIELELEIALEPEALTTDTAREVYTRASWDDITAITDEHWPDDIDEAGRRGTINRFASYQHTMLDGNKIERKNVEALKAFLRERAQAAPAAVWDHLRFAAAMSLYAAHTPNFGRGMARAMDDPVLMGAVVHALIDNGRDKEAMDVVNDIPYYPTRAKVLYTGEWQDRAAVEALLEDITHATQKTHRKYDPGLRVGIAVGLQELFAFNADSAAVANNPTESARWQAEADKMASRVALLQRQIASGFIRPPKK